MHLHKQFLQLGIINVLLLAITVYALYNARFEMAFVCALMLLVSLAPLYLKAVHDVYVPAVFMYVTIVFIFSSVFFGQFGGLFDRWRLDDSFFLFFFSLP